MGPVWLRDVLGRFGPEIRTGAARCRVGPRAHSPCRMPSPHGSGEISGSGSGGTGVGVAVGVVPPPLVAGSNTVTVYVNVCATPPTTTLLIWIWYGKSAPGCGQFAASFMLSGRQTI